MRTNRHEPRETFRETPTSIVVPHVVADECGSGDEIPHDAAPVFQHNVSGEIRDLIGHYQALGPTKKAYSNNTEKYLSRQRDIWIQFCQSCGLEPEETIKSAEVAVFKAFLDWRVKNGGITKISTTKSYWKALSLVYAATTKCWLDQSVLYDMNNFLSQDLQNKYSLSRDGKEKSALFVEDLDCLLTHHWMRDTEVFPHERMRLQLAMILLLAGATSTRPGALLQLRYRDISFAVFPSQDNVSRSSLTMTIRLTETKTRSGKKTPTKFGFREEINLVHCPVLGMLALSLADKALEGDPTLEAVHQLRVPKDKDRIRFPVKVGLMDSFVFRNGAGLGVDGDSYDYHSARNALVRLGKSCGYLNDLMFYDLRRATGKKLTKEVSPEERNQIMGHSGGTSSVYRQYYMPEFVDRDVQAIYFGSTRQDDLIRAIGRIPRNGKAPTRLTEDQKDSVRQDPELIKASQERDRLKTEIRRSFGTVTQAGKLKIESAQALVKAHGIAKNKVNSIRSKLQNELLDRTIQDFHASSDLEAVQEQVGTNSSSQSCSQDQTPWPVPDFELTERRQVAEVLSIQSSRLDTLGIAELDDLRVQLVAALTALCQMKETPCKFRQRSQSTSTGNKAKKARQCFPTDEIQGMQFNFANAADKSCPFCRIDPTCGPWKQGHQFARMDVLGRHIFEQHFDQSGKIRDATDSAGDGPAFDCPYAGCSTPLFSARDFACHAHGSHGIDRFPSSTIPGDVIGSWTDLISHH